MQPLSIDEAALDLAGTEALHGAPPAVVLARFVRDVEATIGVTAARRHRCWHPSPVRLLPGIGPTLARRLAAQGITLLGHLQVLSDREARRRLGDDGPALAAPARGGDVRRVDPARETRSISAETTFDTDLTQPADLERHLWRLAEKLARRPWENELSAGGVVLNLPSARERRGCRARRCCRTGYSTPRARC